MVCGSRGQPAVPPGGEALEVDPLDDELGMMDDDRTDDGLEDPDAGAEHGGHRLPALLRVDDLVGV